MRRRRRCAGRRGRRRRGWRTSASRRRAATGTAAARRRAPAGTGTSAPCKQEEKRGMLDRGRGMSWVQGSVCFVVKFALPLFSPSSLGGASFKTKQALNRASNEYGSFENSNLEYSFVFIFEFRINSNMVWPRHPSTCHTLDD